MEMRRCTVAEILRLRHAVLRQGKPIETAHFEGDGEAGTLHYALFEDDQPRVCLSLLQRNIALSDIRGPFMGVDFEKAAATIFGDGLDVSELGELEFDLLKPCISADSKELRSWQLRGMATATAGQGKGFGSQLIRIALADAASLLYSSFFWCNARLKAVPFYEKNGWMVISDQFNVPGIGPHHRMITRFKELV